MHDLITFLTLATSVAICVRILSYRRPPDARYRLWISVMAWVLVASTGSQALLILINGGCRYGAWKLGLLLVLAVLAFRARGNVARIFKVD